MLHKQLLHKYYKKSLNITSNLKTEQTKNTEYRNTTSLF